MSLTSPGFFLFFLIVFFSCLLLGDRHNEKKWILTLASYYFYMSIDWRFALLLLGLTTVNHLAGTLMLACRDAKQRKRLAVAAIALSLAVLFYFKYFNFFVTEVARFLNLELDPRHTFIFSTVLPVGISFMTFQAITYPLDILQGRVQKRANALDFALFMAFFPRLLSGPIVRAGQFLPQLEGPGRVSGNEVMEGMFLIFRGLMKKILIADVLAVEVVDPAFSRPDQYSSLFLVVAVVGFSFQVYADLSGYTDIALGTARMLGYKLPVNFNRPYLATSIANYWQRWHISMSSFFRDYLYEAISSWSWCNVYIKLLIVFVAIGLWHGAGWNFVVYGFIHGTLVGLEHYRTARQHLEGRPTSVHRGLRLAVQITLVFTIVSFTRVLFRGEDLATSIHFYHLLIISESTQIPLTWTAVGALSLACALHFTPINWRERCTTIFVGLPAAVSAPAIVVLIYVMVALSNGEAGFIYFRF